MLTLREKTDDVIAERDVSDTGSHADTLLILGKYQIF